MKDNHDDRTADVFPPAKKGRGRPRTGAKTSNERVMEKQARELNLAKSGNFDDISISGLLDLMRGDDFKFLAWAEFGKRADFLTDWQQFHGKEPVKNDKK